MVRGHLASVRSEKGNVRVPDSANTRNELQDGLVSLPSHPRSDGANPKPMLDGKVEMDETYADGKGHRRDRPKDKEVVIAMRKRRAELRFFDASDVKWGTLEKYIRENISEDVDMLFTDDFNLYQGAARHLRKQGKHKMIRHSWKIYAAGDVHTNSVESALSLLKRGIIRTWHKISAKHLPAYLEEIEFRFNRRKRSDLFVDTLRHMVTAAPLTLERLTA